jgi:hypothetical protein
VASEYGVGKAVALPTIAEGALPAGFYDISIPDYRKWVAGRFDGTHPQWGTPNPNTIYLVFSTRLDSCAGTGAWHDEVAVPVGGKNVTVTYAMILSCNRPDFPSLLDALTIGTSHELIEAATDPHPYSEPAYDSIEGNHAEWAEAADVTELADLCQDTQNPEWLPLDGGKYNVARVWSNAALKAGLNPCVPDVSGQVFLGGMPVMSDSVMVQDTPATGVVIPMGQSRTIDVKLFSLAPTAGPWKVSATGFITDGGSDELSFAFDHDSGSNGDTLKLTITVIRQDAIDFAERFIVTSTDGDRTYHWLGVVGN